MIEKEEIEGIKCRENIKSSISWKIVAVAEKYFINENKGYTVTRTSANRNNSGQILDKAD